MNHYLDEDETQVDNSLSRENKLNTLTSQFVRAFKVINISRKINNSKIKINDAYTILKIYNCIQDFDLCDDRYGSRIKKATLDKFIAIVDQNGNLAKEVEELNKLNVLYKENSLEK